MEAVFQYFWVIFIAVTCFGAFNVKRRAAEYIAADPALEEGYNDIIKAMLIGGNIPWVIVGIGCLTGMTNGLFAFFQPRLLNPFVLAFHVSIIVIWILLVRWIYFKNGAEFLERHPGIIQSKGFNGKISDVSAKQIKLFFPLMLAGGVIAMVMMWVQVIPVPHFK